MLTEMPRISRDDNDQRIALHWPLGREEEQRRARMEKMIQRAKSTLPPEARGGAKPSASKKSSPYSAQNNAVKAGARKRSTGGQGTPAGGVPVDVQELDNLIYNQVQEILGMPLMQRAAAARTASKGTTPHKPPMSGRVGRRPAWNSECKAQGPGSPTNHEELHLGGVGARSGASNTTFGIVQQERSPSKSAGSNARPSLAQGTTRTLSKNSRIPAAGHMEMPVSGISLSAPPQRRPVIRTQPAEERVVLLPSPGASGTVIRASPGVRPASSRYGSGAGAPPGGGDAGSQLAAAGRESSDLLGKSVVAAIEALNPDATAAAEVAHRIAQRQQSQRTGQQWSPPQHQQRIGDVTAVSPATRSYVCTYDAGGATSLLGLSDVMGSRQLSDNVSTGAAGLILGRDRDASLMKSLSAAVGVSQGGSPATVSLGASSRRPPPGPAARASGRGALQLTQQASLTAARGHQAATAGDEDDAYADDQFEEYDGTDEERERDEDRVGDEDVGGGGAPDITPDIAFLRESVNALNGLVQLKIQQELARSQQQWTQHDSALQRDSPQASCPGARLLVPHPEMLASLPLVGSGRPDMADGLRVGSCREDPAYSSLGDGLRESDLHYLARLGGGEPHEVAEVANSTDERLFAIEPGAPTGTAKAWGDRQPWTDKGSNGGAIGLQRLRDRQARERHQQQQHDMAFESGPRSSSQQEQGSEGKAGLGPSNTLLSGRIGTQAQTQGDEEDSVLLGETVTPRQRAAAAAQMQAVGNALAALASSGHLNREDAQELRTQTDALFGSLAQLHDLMTGPRGAELFSGSPTRDSGGKGGAANATGFTPAATSPADSPSQSVGRHTSSGAGPEAPANEEQEKGSSVRMTMQPVGPSNGGLFRVQRTPTDGGEPGQGAGSHMQLTPKHRLIAEDVAWMAGLAQSLSKSLQVESEEVELPGM